MVLFDGLNRFYVAAGESTLADALSSPASVIDEFEKSTVRAMRLRLEELRDVEQQAAAARVDREQAELAVAAVKVGLGELSQLLAENVERQRALTVEIDRRDVLLGEMEERRVDLEQRLSEMRAQEARVRAELAAIQQTKIFRYSRLPRQVYKRLFRR
jgi:septal ring factor EnvC (AmiA/AmiB activator)